MRYGIVIDRRRCFGCNACTIACKQKNGTPPGVFLARVLVNEVGQYPAARREYLPVICNHCSEPACVEVCPTGASQKLANGAVIVDPELCIGCRSCMVACPYNARTFNYGKPVSYFTDEGYTPYEEALLGEHPAGVVTKCNLCIDLLAEGKDPACIQVCPAKARIFGDLDDPDSEVSQLIASRSGYQLHAELGTDPSVYYLPG